jgi:hypothetical protein
MNWKTFHVHSWRLPIIKMSTLSSMIYRFKCNPYQNFKSIFWGNWKFNLKIPRNPRLQNNLKREKKTKTESLILSDFKIYYMYMCTVTKTVWYCCKDRKRQQSRIRIVYSLTYTARWFPPGTLRPFIEKIAVFFKQIMLRKLDIHLQYSKINKRDQIPKHES